MKLKSRTERLQIPSLSIVTVSLVLVAVATVSLVLVAVLLHLASFLVLGAASRIDSVVWLTLVPSMLSTLTCSKSSATLYVTNRHPALRYN